MARRLLAEVVGSREVLVFFILLLVANWWRISPQAIKTEILD